MRLRRSVDKPLLRCRCFDTEAAPNVKGKTLERPAALRTGPTWPHPGGSFPSPAPFPRLSTVKFSRRRAQGHGQRAGACAAGGAAGGAPAMSRAGPSQSCDHVLRKGISPRPDPGRPGRPTAADRPARRRWTAHGPWQARHDPMLARADSLNPPPCIFVILHAGHCGEIVGMNSGPLTV